MFPESMKKNFIRYVLVVFFSFFDFIIWQIKVLFVNFLEILPPMKWN